MIDISVIIMAYNEEDTVVSLTEEIRTVLSDMGKPCEILIIDDGSLDNTGKRVDHIKHKYNEIRIIRHPVNLGLGGVYRTGFTEAKGDFVTFFPADGQFPAEIIRQFRPMMKDFDMVLGYLPERKGSAVSKVLSTIERWLYAVLFGPLPRFQGIIMFKRPLLDEFKLKSLGRGWAVLMELIIRTKRAGHKIISVPTRMRQRKNGFSKVNNLGTIFANLIQVITLRCLL